jgi:predicted DNA-binding protein YlxM (UPF0122 family)
MVYYVKRFALQQKKSRFGGSDMFEKNLEMSFLLDFYGDVLSERRRSVMAMYYNEDLSLSEIADEIGISRQGVRDLIKKSEEELVLLEQKLGLAAKFEKLKACADRIDLILASHEMPFALREEISSLTDEIKNNT